MACFEGCERTCEHPGCQHTLNQIRFEGGPSRGSWTEIKEWIFKTARKANPAKFGITERRKEDRGFRARAVKPDHEVMLRYTGPSPIENTMVHWKHLDQRKAPGGHVSEPKEAEPRRPMTLLAECPNGHEIPVTFSEPPGTVIHRQCQTCATTMALRVPASFLIKG